MLKYVGWPERVEVSTEEKLIILKCDEAVIEQC
jgi:hypothetical protein